VIEVQEKTAVKIESVAFAALRVAGELSAAHGQVRVPLDFDIASQEIAESIAMPAHDETIGVRDGGSFTGDRKCKIVVQATWTLQDSSAAAGSAEDGYSHSGAFV